MSTETSYLGRHRRPQDMDERHADARAAGLCGACEGRRASFGIPCDGCGGVGTATAQTDVTLTHLERELGIR